MKRRVVITGVGPVTPIGIGKEPFWESLLLGKSGARKIHFDNYDMQLYSSKIACTIEDFSLNDWIDQSKDLKYLGRISRLSLAGAKLALEDSGFEMEFEKNNGHGCYHVNGLSQKKCGVILGVGNQDTSMYDDVFKTFLRYNGPKRVSPFALPNININSAAAVVSIKFGIKGSCFTISSACTSSTHAIIESCKQIIFGKEDIILSGGTEAAITPTVFAGFDALKAMSKKNERPKCASRPFDKDRDGFVMGEGSGIIVLEELSHALKRGAPIYAEITGYGQTSDAYHITAPNPKADMQAEAIKEALLMSNTEPGEIDYINAHGTSTPLNDPIETLAIKKSFGKTASEIPISSTKSMTGHLLGASGGIEVIASALTVKKNKIHHTVHLEEPGENCDLNYVRRQTLEKPVNNAVKNSFGFGGQNAVLVIKKYD